MDDSRRCTAKSTRSHERCKKAAIKGGTVCATHGGSAPQVKNSAMQRLLDAADPAAARLVQLVSSKDERIGLAAARDLLDRLGHKAPTEIKIESVDQAARILRDELERRARDG